MRIGTSIALLISVLAIGCGPSGRDNGGGGDGGPGMDTPTGNFATITGKVWAPNQGPGQAVLGQEIPIAGALVYVSQTRPTPIPEGVYCQMCVNTPQGGVLSGADGSFKLDVAPGRYWVVIEKGQFRIEAEYDLPLGTTSMTPQQTTLPSVHDPATGRYMPKIALAPGSNDSIEDILGKLGFGTMSGNSFSTPAGEMGNELVVLDYAGAVTAPGSVAHLLANIEEMRKYHIIFFPCQAGIPTAIDTMLQDQTILANLRRYVNEGGKLYVTDWSGEVADRAFPQQVMLGDLDADSDGTYDPATFTGTLTVVGNANGDLYDVNDGKAIDQGLHAWLGLQTGPTDGGGVMTYNPDAFEVTDLWNWIKKVNAVQLGTDDQGLPVYDTPKVWATGSAPVTGGANRPIAVTYQPTGCGKVLYTSFQTSSSSHDGLYPKERLLLYLIMEIQTCSDSPIL